MRRLAAVTRRLSIRSIEKRSFSGFKKFSDSFDVALKLRVSYCSDRRKAFLTFYRSGWRQCEAVANRMGFAP